MSWKPFVQFDPFIKEISKEYLTPYGDTIQRIFDPRLWEKNPSVHKFQAKNTHEIFYSTNADPEETYHQYLEIAKTIRVKDDVIERLPSLPSPERERSYTGLVGFSLPVHHFTDTFFQSYDHRYKSHKLDEIFTSSSADIYKSYKDFLQQFHPFI